MKIERILVGTDTSKASQIAVNQSAALAAHLDAELVVMYVGTKPEHEEHASTLLAVSSVMNQLAEEMFNKDQRTIDYLVKTAEEAGARVVRHVVSGDPADAICEAAIELDADLVVTGTRGRSGLGRLLLGSVAERVVHTCSKPTMVARGDHIPSGGYKRVLVPTDFSQHADAAVDLALAVGAPDLELELLHCWQLPTGVGAGPASVVGPIMESIDKKIRAKGADTVSSLVDAGATVSFHATMAPPAQGVADRIEAGGFDLVVLGTHGRRGISRFLLGSVAEAAVHHAPCSVLVVPPHEGIA